MRFRVAGRRQRIERAQAEAPAEADAADDAGMEHVLSGQVDLCPEVVAEALARAGVLTLRQLLDEELVVLADEAVREPRLAARQRAGHRQARRPVLDAQPLLAHDGREEVRRRVAQPVAADVRRHLDDAAAALAELGRVDAAAHRQRLHGLDADPRIEAAVQRIADVEAVQDEERLALAGAVDVDAAGAVHDHARQRAQRVLDAVRSVERHVHRLGAAECLLRRRLADAGGIAARGDVERLEVLAHREERQHDVGAGRERHLLVLDRVEALALDADPVLAGRVDLEHEGARGIARGPRHHVIRGRRAHDELRRGDRRRRVAHRPAADADLRLRGRRRSQQADAGQQAHGAEPCPDAGS